VHDPLARQIRRQGLAAVTFGRRFCRRGRRGLGRGLGCRRCLGLRRGSFDDLRREEQELVGVEFLGLAAIELAEELFELVLEFFVEVGLLAEGRDQFADEPVGGFEVVGKWGSRSRWSSSHHYGRRLSM
jgi:hypothetical protein